jgi:hypothetical protein
MSMIRRCLTTFLLLALAPMHRVSGQLGCSGATCTVQISMPVTDVLRISLGTTSVGLGAPSDVDYQAGYRDVGGVAVSVNGKSNRPFQVAMSALTGTFLYAGSMADPNKPASDLKWATSAGALPTTANHMGTSAMLINQGAGNVTVPLYMRTLWDFTKDVPGTYSLAIRFTVSAP